MKDLLIHAADADAEAFLRSLLNRPEALAIRPISFDIHRHPQRDAGMVQSGAELARMNKGRYQKVLLLWDHHGSGRERRQTPEQVVDEISRKLDSFTWSENHKVEILVPELEQWLWFCESAVAAHCGVTVNRITEWQQDYATKLGRTVGELKQNFPKELFEHLMRERLRQTISPRNFQQIGERASVRSLLHCKSFKAVVMALQSWFPKP
ncbi:MAG: hypothetical protein IPL58_00575 [Betaproteobacteria bacterium]|jgi:hypothetical protein|uniref:DUF4276 family protein n=1 Tax=Candidatus Proximibacter danicus TaxID=2954365 RepID=A0A9D7JXU6_9PROT|nr:hypothetical protein [Candidatus Proximibacter danicus]MBK9447661.1 hypothetical protein [Betaproteobacteria bacterium]